MGEYGIQRTPVEAAALDTHVAVGAFEAAVALARQKGNTVTLSYRRDDFVRLKEKNDRNVRAMMASGKIRAEFSSEVASIGPDAWVDTGTMYRAVALLAVRRGLDRYAISVNAAGRVIVDPSRTFRQPQWDDPASFIAAG